MNICQERRITQGCCALQPSPSASKAWPPHYADASRSHDPEVSFLTTRPAIQELAAEALPTVAAGRAGRMKPEAVSACQLRAVDRFVRSLQDGLHLGAVADGSGC